MKPAWSASSNATEPSALNAMSLTDQRDVVLALRQLRALVLVAAGGTCAARPEKTFCAVVRWLWSWYQSVRACCQFGYL